MYNLQEAYNNEYITLNEIFSKVSEYELWKYYCSNFQELDKSFISDLYNDKNPSCRLIRNTIGGYYYKDFGENHYFSNVIDYIKVKYNASFSESLNIISNDFNIKKINIKINKEPSLINIEERLIIKPKSTIDIKIQPFNITDFNYWSKYKIDLEILDREEIYSCKYVYLTKYDKTFVYESKKNFPIYAFKEYDIDLNFLGYKIYMPYASKKNKWISNSSYKVIQGIKSLSCNTDTLIIGKARKDGICYKLIGYDCVSPQNETSNLDDNKIETLCENYPNIYVNFDLDEQGIRESKRIYDKYGFKYFFIDEYKDLSDYIVDHTLKQAKRMIDKKIKELI